jgi:glycosyltransferase involved in cell wall biosynthesis
MIETGLSRSASHTRPGLTVLILARNEESCIARAIGSVRFADEVLVLDSESTDRTSEIASRLGARVVLQPFLGFGAQHRRGVALAKHDWILSIDADEIVTPELAASINAALDAGPDPRDGYVLVRLEEFLGRIMPGMRRRSKQLNFVRMFNRQHSNWNADHIVHEEIEAPGRRIMIGGPLLHWRNYTIAAQLRTLERNSELEAKMLNGTGRASLLTLMFKPLLRFGWIYIACGCWKQGARGFIWAGLHAFGEFLRQSRAWEQRHVTPLPHPPRSLYAGPLNAEEVAPRRSAPLPEALGS